jgi:electron transfer flavoprotein beta subunit
MRIVVTVKQVPDTNAEKTFDAATKRLNRTSIENVLNPFDEYAIEEALRLKESIGGDSKVTILTMAPERGKEIVRKALAMGADDAVMISSDELGGGDTFATAYVLAQALKTIGYDLILTGTQSTDAVNAVVPAAIAERLGIPCLTYARKIAIEGNAIETQRESESGYLRVKASLPALASVTKSANEPRYPSLKGIMGAKKKEIKALTLADIGVESGKVGDAGSKTKVESIEPVGARAKGTVIQSSDGHEAAQKIMEFLIAKKVI